MIPITCCTDKFIWQSDFDGADYGYMDGEVELVSNFMCPECGRTLEVIRWSPEYDG
ncbi:MAG: hypothetical protein ACRCZZ_04095 [Phocaeicola sp.]